MRPGSTPSRGFQLACGAVALGLVGVCGWVASIEWFSRDDFAFLAHVRGDDFRWSHTFFPGEPRFWHFYRPLGMETYFRLCDAVFGLEAAGYFAVSLAFHFGSGLLLLGVGRALGLDPRAGLAAALLLVSRPPALDQIFYGSVFHFVLSVFLTLVAVRCFLMDLDGAGAKGQLGALTALVLALLTNAVNAVLPAVLVCVGLASRPPGRASLRRVLWVATPHAGVVALYLGLRLTLIPLVSGRAIYEPTLGLETVGKAASLAAETFGGATGATLALTLAIGLAALVWRADEERARVGWRALWLLAWAAAAVAPFVLLPFPQQRYAMLLAAPLALLCGVLFDAAWRVFGTRHPRWFEAALLAAVVAALPFGVLAERVRDPRGVHPLALLRAVESRRAGIAPNARIVVLYGAPPLAAADTAIPYRYLAYNGAVLQAAYPETEQSLRFHDLSQRSPRGAIRPATVYLQLSGDLEIEDAEAELLERELDRGRETQRR